VSHARSRKVEYAGYGEVMNVSVWNRGTTDFYGRSVSGSYVIENDTTIMVRIARQQGNAAKKS
jgi:hypothetical protein